MQDIHIPEDKKERITRAAMKNFAKNGYKKATMDEIVADAGISKGLIFHYFGSKKKLYLYLYEFAYGLVYERVTTEFDAGETDLFQRIRQTELVKLEIMRMYPYVMDFLTSTRRERDERLQEEIGRLKGENFPDWAPAFLSGVDASKLREGVSLEKAVKVILWCTNGLLAEHKDNFVLEDIFAEMDTYLEMMRCAFYKEEYL